MLYFTTAKREPKKRHENDNKNDYVKVKDIYKY